MTQFGEATWGALYQTDTRRRGEHMDTIHYQHLHAHNVAVTAQKPSTYDAFMPWDAVWETAMNDYEWWRAEYEIQAYRIMMGKSAIPQQIATTARSAPPPQKSIQSGSDAPELCKDFNRRKCAKTKSVQCPKHPNKLSR
jgi:deoxyribodipyrimidine photolyase